MITKKSRLYGARFSVKKSKTFFGLIAIKFLGLEHFYRRGYLVLLYSVFKEKSSEKSESIITVWFFSDNFPPFQ